ncbi:endonuclease/exonuclease/phosphatase family protein [Tothia fuscella]|uniref:Endonuclease/exonuclease/phosphatase family protein n=1 Tax=Tothia fuscella TaxID=1048955 RepID=A0A9P4NHU9_9PEZI|nr:endonuclease/exonuclease/phosphatase family protein [Tothia fuscella]
MKLDAATVLLPVRVLVHNIRYATTSPFLGEQLWALRAPKILNELKYNTRHINESFICLQEALNGQVNDILTGLNSDVAGQWSYIGVGRDDGMTAGEYSPIFYRPDTWTLIGNVTKWLSETPDVPSKGWDAASIRIVNIGNFEHTVTKHHVLVMNTHLDDQGAQSRVESAKQLRTYIYTYLAQAPYPLQTALVGDFNSDPTDEAYGILTAADSPVRDLYMRCPLELHYGHNNTYTGFGSEPNLKAERIDYILTGKDAGWVPQGYAVLENRFDDGVYVSDHRAVVGDWVIRRSPNF